MNKILMERAADVLLVVSDIGELRQIRDSLQRANAGNRLHHVGDAVEAKAYIRREEPYARAPIPGLVLLDASLPGNSVIDLITELKTNPQFGEIPVIALVGPESEQTLIESCMYAADGSIQKPFDLCELARLLGSVDTFVFSPDPLRTD